MKDFISKVILGTIFANNFAIWTFVWYITLLMLIGGLVINYYINTFLYLFAISVTNT